MEILENKFLENDGKNTTGNIDSVCDIREKVSNQEFEKYDKKFNFAIKERKTFERKIKNEPKYNARDKMGETRKTIMKNIKNDNTPAIKN